jgi:RNA polymerase sigma-70 factor (ECF subfamily)
MTSKRTLPEAEYVIESSQMIVAQIPHLRRYALALLGDSERADDLVQDCLERAWSRFHLFREDGNLRAWLFTIMHNVNANAARRASRRPRTVPYEHDRHAMPVAGNQEDRVAVAALWRALEDIPVEQREVVLLVGLEQMTYEEVARILDIPVGTVMSRLHRGRERLRSIYDGQIGPSIRRVK